MTEINFEAHVPVRKTFWGRIPIGRTISRRFYTHKAKKIEDTLAALYSPKDSLISYSDKVKEVVDEWKGPVDQLIGYDIFRQIRFNDKRLEKIIAEKGLENIEIKRAKRVFSYLHSLAKEIDDPVKKFEYRKRYASIKEGKILAESIANHTQGIIDNGSGKDPSEKYSSLNGMKDPTSGSNPALTRPEVETQKHAEEPKLENIVSDTSTNHHTRPEKNLGKQPINKKGPYTESDLIKALREHETYVKSVTSNDVNVVMTKQQYGGDDALKKAIAIADWLDANTKFKFRRRDRDHNIEAYNLLNRIQNNYWSLMPEGDRKPLAKMFARRCWQESMHTLYYTFKRDGVVLANGRDAIGRYGNNPKAYKKFCKEISRCRYS